MPQRAALDELLAAAAGYFGCARENLLAAAGSQELLQRLPTLLPSGRVAVRMPTYAEHAHRWAAAGHYVVALEDLSTLPPDCRYLVVTNPNNPTGEVVHPEVLLALADELAARDGLLLVDEAFADLMPSIGVAAFSGRPGLAVLRSFGKFFGLAGLRLGFLAGPRDLIYRMADALGPWPLSGPAIEIGRRAYLDVEWIAVQRQRLAGGMARLRPMLADAGTIVGGTDLFSLLRTPAAPALFDRLAAAGILVRRFDDRPDWLRFGLPGTDDEFARLQTALAG